MIYPINISLRNWAGSLVIDYPDSKIPILLNEKDWKEWAAILSNTGIFFEKGIPNPFTIRDGKQSDNYDSWEVWARAVYITMLDYPEIEKSVI